MAKLTEFQTDKGERLVINADHVLHMAAVGTDKTRITFAVSDVHGLSTVTLAGELTLMMHKMRIAS